MAFYRNGEAQTVNVDYAVNENRDGVLGSDPDMEKSIGYNGPAYGFAYLNAALDHYELFNDTATAEQALALYEENKEEIVALLKLSEELHLRERCRGFGAEFRFFVHTGGCDGENRKQYGIWIKKENIPEALISCYLNYESLLTERECCERLKEDATHWVHHNEKEIVLLISNTCDVFFNFTQMSKEWKIGNLKTDDREELIRRVVEEDIPALNLAGKITLGELAAKYGNPESDRAFQLNDYKDYLLNRYLEDVCVKA